MAKKTFFNEQKEQSEAKARIVQKYFKAWANVILSQRNVDKIAYIDLFAGPGRYEDGANSTPLLVLETAIKEEKICKSLVTIFNDKDSSATSKLTEAVKSIDGIDTLRFCPKICNMEVGTKIVEMFESMKLVPTLFFIDPWGYKGLSLKLVNSVLKNWGCDCIFFFNYNRINMGISNPAVKEHMSAIFGGKRLKEMNKEISNFTSEERELYILKKLCEAFKDHSQQELYILPFGFCKPDYRISHHLIFASKHFKGYEIMKDIMAKESSNYVDNVPSFEYSPAGPKFPILYLLSKPLEELKEMLKSNFAGKTCSVDNIYKSHSLGTRFIKKNYKTAIMEMEEAGEVSVHDPEDKERRKDTLAGRLLVTFS